MAELYTLASGQVLTDEHQSEMMYKLVSLRPEVSYTWDDIGTADLMSDMYSGEIAYCPQNDSWYIWNGCWRRQLESGNIDDRIITVLNLLHLYAGDQAARQSDFPDKYGRYVSTLRRHSGISNVREVLKNNIRMQQYEMDTDPYLFNTPARAYNLKTGARVVDFTRVTKLCATSAPNALTQRCDRWYQFIDEIMSHDSEKAKFLQRALGYSILGVNREECMFMAYGSTTRNGKGTLFSTINTVLGPDYADSAPVDLICERKGKAVDFNAPQPALAKLVGTRLVTMSESPRDVRLDAAAMKTITGRDALVARGLFEKPFTFVPQFTLWLNTNFLPSVNDDTVFASDRIWVIEFNEHFDTSRQDKDLKELFTDPANRPTILQWLLDGVSDYMTQGLAVPDSVRAATASYRKLHDRIGAFIEDALKVDPERRANRGEVYTAYRKWCARPENRFTPLGSTTFYSEIANKGFQSVRYSDAYYLKGCALRDV